MITQFVYNANIAATPPECRMKELYDKINSLTPAEKQEVFDNCFPHDRGIYRLSGWQFNYKHAMKRYVVKQHGSWSEVYAFNKTNIRKNNYMKGITEIHEIPNLNKKQI